MSGYAPLFRELADTFRLAACPRCPRCTRRMGLVSSGWKCSACQMATVSYKNQPAIHRTGAHVPLAGDSHVYTVAKVLWPEEVESFIESLFLGKTLHVCAGKSRLGDCRVDMHEPTADVLCDAARLPFLNESWPTVLCDPPYNGKFQWNHDLLSELSRVAAERIIFQHWFMPITPDGKWKKWQDKWHLTAVYVWQPRTYFGRAQVISVLDKTCAAQVALSQYAVAPRYSPQ